MWVVQPKPEPCVGGLGNSMYACNRVSHDACVYLPHIATVLQNMESVYGPHAYCPPPPKCEGVTFPGLYMQFRGCDTIDLREYAAVHTVLHCSTLHLRAMVVRVCTIKAALQHMPCITDLCIAVWCGRCGAYMYTVHRPVDACVVCAHA